MRGEGVRGKTKEVRAKGEGVIGEGRGEGVRG